MRLLAATVMVVMGLVVTSVLGLGYLVTAWSGAGEAAGTRAAQHRLAQQVPEASTPPEAQLALAPPERGRAPGLYTGEAGTATAERRTRRTPVATTAEVGEALAVMRIPRFGVDWRWVALEGTADHVIADGPGHYPWTPLPGQRGNVGFAAHRSGHGDPFIDFDRLRPGDQVVLSQGGTRWVYRLDSRPRIIPTTASWVLNPLPGHRLTLTTCWPKYGSAKRMYIRGHLVRTYHG